MRYVEVNGICYPLVSKSGALADSAWGGRESTMLTLVMTYAEAAANFVDGADWSIINQPDPITNEAGDKITLEPTKTSCADFSIAGSITDHRNGRVTVKMGKPTGNEILKAQLAKAVTAEELETAYTEGVNSL